MVVLKVAGRGIRTERGGQRARCLKLDADGAPIEIHGHQAWAEWSARYGDRIYHPMTTSIAVTGGILDACLGPGNIGTA